MLLHNFITVLARINKEILSPLLAQFVCRPTFAHSISTVSPALILVTRRTTDFYDIKFDINFVGFMRLKKSNQRRFSCAMLAKRLIP